MTSSAVESLKAYYKDSLHYSELVELSKEIVGLNDRAAIILAATFVDNGLVRHQLEMKRPSSPPQQLLRLSP
jgi:hypothetical protein